MFYLIKNIYNAGLIDFISFLIVMGLLCFVLYKLFLFDLRQKERKIKDLEKEIQFLKVRDRS